MIRGRRVRYQVAASLDGFIAGPNGEVDWIVMDPEIDFGEIFSRFDTLLVGRRTFELMASGPKLPPGIKVVVFSRTLKPADYPDTIVVTNNAPEFVSDLRAQPGKDIWVFGGGQLFSSLAAANLVDTVEIAVMPVVLGGGIPLAPNLPRPTKLELTGHKIYRTGIVLLEYAMS